VLPSRALAPVSLVAVAVTAGIAGSAAADHHDGATAAAKRPYTSTLEYRETNHGSDQSSGAIKGIVGRGTVSAHLGPAAAIAARVIGAATGVPLADVAKGGAYAVRSDVDEKGNFSGVLVVKLKAKGLGTMCFGYTAKRGQFNGGSFVPTSGSVKSLGGVGKTAKWRLSAAFDLTGLSGQDTEQFKARGSAHASTGRKKGFTAACKEVAKLPRG
jgi:hypothetical protein